MPERIDYEIPPFFRMSPDQKYEYLKSLIFPTNMPAEIPTPEGSENIEPRQEGESLHDYVRRQLKIVSDTINKDMSDGPQEPEQDLSSQEPESGHRNEIAERYKKRAEEQKHPDDDEPRAMPLAAGGEDQAHYYPSQTIDKPEDIEQTRANVATSAMPPLELGSARARRDKGPQTPFGHVARSLQGWEQEVAQKHAKLAVAPPIPQRKPFHFPAGRRGFLALLGTTAVAVATYIGLDKLFGSAPAAGGPPLPPPTSTPDINGQNASGTADALNAQAQQEAARLAEQQRLEEEARKTAQAAEAQRLQEEAEAAGTAQAALPSNTPRPENTPNPETILNSVRVSVQLSQEARAEHKISVGYQDNMNMLDPGDGQIIEAEEAVRRQFLHAMYWAATNSQNPTIEPKRDVVETLAQVQDINGIDPKNGATITIVPWSEASQDPSYKVSRTGLSGAPSLIIKDASERGVLSMNVGIDFSTKNSIVEKSLSINSAVINALAYASDPTIFEQQVMENQTTRSREQALGEYTWFTADGDTFPFVVRNL